MTTLEGQAPALTLTFKNLDRSYMKDMKLKR